MAFLKGLIRTGVSALLGTDPSKSVKKQITGGLGLPSTSANPSTPKPKAAAAGTVDGIPTEWVLFAADNIINALADGASDLEIRANWAKRPSGMKLVHVFHTLRGSTLYSPSENILIANELERILSMKHRRRAVPKWITSTIQKVSAIKRLVRVSEGVRIVSKRKG